MPDNGSNKRSADEPWDEIVLGLIGNLFRAGWEIVRKAAAGWPYFTERQIVKPDASFELRAREPEYDELALGMARWDDDEQNKEIKEQVGISTQQRGTHMYVVGGSGFGKTKFLESLVRQDIDHQRGFGVIDPHGDLIDDIKAYLYDVYGEESAFLRENVVLIDPANPDRVVGFNPLEPGPGVSPAQQVKRLVAAFEKIWGSSWGERMAGIFRYSLFALCENHLTLADLPLFLTNTDVRERILQNVTNQACLDYFRNEFGQKAKKTVAEWIEAPLNKTNSFLFDPLIRQMLGSGRSTFNLREIMDEGKILLVRLDQGQLLDGADIVGSLLMSLIQANAFARTDQLKSERGQFFLYVDEFQNFATDNFVQTLNEARKYGLSLVLAHQHLFQLTPLLRASALGNCWIQVFFQVTHDDGAILAREAIAPAFPGSSNDDAVRTLQTLEKRMFIIRDKPTNEVQKLESLDVEYPWGEDREAEKTYRRQVNAAGIGSAFLRERVELETEYHERRRWLLGEDEDEETAREHKAQEPHGLSEAKMHIAKRWVQIEEDLKTGERAHLRNAVNESETILELALKALGHEGESINERLKNMPHDILTDFPGLRTARHIRNSLQHDGFELTFDMAQASVAQYKRALRDLGVLDYD